VNVLGNGGGIGDGVAMVLGGEFDAVDAELDAPGLGRRESGARSFPDHLALGFADEDVQDQARGVWVVASHELGVRLATKATLRASRSNFAINRVALWRRQALRVSWSQDFGQRS
jgi:hypothetical protein